MENEKMVTLVTMEKLLDTKLAQLENRIMKEFKENVCNNPIAISDVIPASIKVPASVVPTEHIRVDTSLIHHTPLIPVKSFHEECVEVVQQVNCLNRMFTIFIFTIQTLYVLS